MNLIKTLLTAVLGLASLNASGSVAGSDAIVSVADSAEVTASFPEASSAGSDNVSERRRATALGFVAPAALIGVGAWGVAGGWPDWLNSHIDDAIGGHGDNHVADLLQFLPDLAMMLPDKAMPPSRYSWGERIALTVTGEIIVEAVTQPLKRIVGERRPDGSDCRSFPSGHAARSFMGAELLRESFGGWTAVAGYTVASATAVLRIVASRHSFTDVLAGAGVGILSARCAVLLLPLERRWFGISGRDGRAVALTPSVDPASRTIALHIAMTL